MDVIKTHEELEKVLKGKTIIAVFSVDKEFKGYELGKYKGRLADGPIRYRGKSSRDALVGDDNQSYHNGVGETVIEFDDGSYMTVWGSHSAGLNIRQKGDYYEHD